ncbi:hypothetical protein F4820DRAFT_419936 [Hypoxylon rubiginosum]|uniref:Uncharacterized protein n=1 Tax=Hypoxylon rubiginosum TaxID=110542 RepID=A0ACB9Z248_9PEZI|nr:hypothetical protein F4820DRAFT_419936 [Hypoxylon rubiginosum]
MGNGTTDGWWMVDGGELGWSLIVIMIAIGEALSSAGFRDRQGTTATRGTTKGPLRDHPANYVLLPRADICQGAGNNHLRSDWKLVTNNLLVRDSCLFPSSRSKFEVDATKTGSDLLSLSRNRSMDAAKVRILSGRQRSRPLKGYNFLIKMAGLKTIINFN